MKNKPTRFLVLFGIVIVALSGCGSNASTTETNTAATVTPQKAEELKIQQIDKYKRMEEQGKTVQPAPAPQ